jgi:methylated-DNA-[protein]-cysteine S-methyltransferase
MPQLSFLTPLGDLTLSEEDGAIVSLDWGRSPPAFRAETALLARARAQLDAYFDGRAVAFDLPLRPAGTPFRQRVWALMAAIPYGRTMSYGEMAARLGSSARAVGGACGANPIPIIIPCHRVLAGGGRLGGYSGDGGVATKAALLRLEGALL